MLGQHWRQVSDWRSRGGVVVRAVRLTVVIQAVLVGAAHSDEFVQDFARDAIDEGMLKIVPSHGRDAFGEDREGLHVRLPLKTPETYQVAIETRFKLIADFDVATDFTLISADRPSEGYGVGVMLRIVKEASPKGPKKRAVLARANQRERGNVFVTSIALLRNSDVSKRWERAFPTEATTGRLRLVRKGAKLQFWVASGANDQFQKVRDNEFGTEAVRSAAVLVYTGQSPSPVEVRIERFIVTAEELTHGTPRRWHQYIWALWTVFGMTGVLLLVAVRLHVVKKRTLGSGL